MKDEKCETVSRFVLVEPAYNRNFAFSVIRFPFYPYAGITRIRFLGMISASVLQVQTILGTPFLKSAAKVVNAVVTAK